MLRRICLAFAIAALLVSRADAGFVGIVSGNTNPGDLVDDPATTGPDQVDGTVNWALFFRDDIDPTDVYGTGFSGFDALFSPGKEADFSTTGPSLVKSTFLYLYQTTNNGDNPPPPPGIITSISVGVDPTRIDSWGHWVGLGLDDITGPVSAADNFGTNVRPGPADPSSPDPANFGVVAPPPVVVAPGGLLTPSLTVRTGSSFFVAFAGFGGGLASSIAGFTSDDLPILTTVGMLDSGAVASGFTIAPGPANLTILPEPASMLIWAGMGLVIGARALRRRKLV